MKIFIICGMFIGKVNCMVAVTEKIVTFTIIPVANYMYSKTLYVMPSCYVLFVIAGAIGEFFSYTLLVEEEEVSVEENALKTEEIDHIQYCEL